MLDENIILKLTPKQKKTVVVAAAEDVAALTALTCACERGFVTGILCGNKIKIEKLAADNHINISPFRIIDCADEISAAKIAVDLIRSSQADILMKGHIHTADILRAVLDKQFGIRSDGILSHVSVLYSSEQQRLLFLTDAAMVMYPDLETKIKLIKNAVYVAKQMGVSKPKIAPLAAVETINPKMQATIDADKLSELNRVGVITDCIISGPLAFDCAVSSKAAKIKQISGPICGDADVLLFHNIEAGNSTLKALVHFGKWTFGGIIMGAMVPIVINSRSDSDESKLFSLLIASNL